MSKPTFAFLQLEEHPYGREMFRQLASAGHVPVLVVQEVSSLAEAEREKFLRRIDGRPVAATIERQARECGIPVVSVPLHSSEELMKHLGPLDLDLIVLGGTRIIRGAILEHPRSGVLNSHPGLLPECRGSASPAWSVYHDIPIGASTHFIDPGIDTGDLLLRREIPVRRGMRYEDLCYETLLLAGVLMKEALQAYERGEWPNLRRPQGASPWPTFRNASEEVLEIVRRKLAQQTYAHYAD